MMELKDANLSRGVLGGSGGVFGGRFVRFLFGVDGGTFILDISNETVVVISSVGDDLNTAIGKVYTV